MSVRHLPLVALTLTAIAMAPLGALARDQWSINHGANNPPVDKRFLPGGQFSGYVPAFNPDFWKGQLASRIPAGTVLTAILEDDLSSLKNKPGDTFALSLDDGFSLNGKVLVPPKSKILGTVMGATSAKMQRNGAPGNLEVSLQTLIFPDGSHYPIYGFIDGNPGAKAKKPAKVQHAGFSLSDYGQSVAGMATSFITGPGWMLKKINKGNEFVLDKGDALPIRLTRSLEVKPPAPGSSVIANPQGPVQVPGFVPVGQLPNPGMSPNAVAPGMPPSVAPPVATNNALGGDPNAVFNQPLQPQHLNDLPDPF